MHRFAYNVKIRPPVQKLCITLWVITLANVGRFLYFFHFLPREADMLARSWDRNSVCLPVRPSVRHTRALWRNERLYCRYCDTNRHWWAMSPFTWHCAWSGPPPFEKRQLRPISAYKVWIVRASKNVQLSRIGICPRAFQRAIDEVRTLLLTPPRGASKSEFVVF